MIPYSRPKLSDFRTLSQTKQLENHTLHSGTYPYSVYMGVPPPPGLLQASTTLLWDPMTQLSHERRFVSPFDKSVVGNLIIKIVLFVFQLTSSKRPRTGQYFDASTDVN